MRPRYRVARAGFALAGLGLFMVSLSQTCLLAAVLQIVPDLWQVMRSVAWDWIVGAPLTLGTFLGSLLFLGRFDDPGWKRRAVPLFLMNTIDLASWCVTHADVLGIHTGPPPVQVGELLQFLGSISPIWNAIEILLFAELARDVCVHLGRTDADAPLATVRSSVGIVVVLHLLFMMMQQMHFRRGWFLLGRGLRNNLMFLELVAEVVSAAFAAFLMVQAARLCSEVVRDLDKQRNDHDPFARS